MINKLRFYADPEGLVKSFFFWPQIIINTEKYAFIYLH